MKLILTLLMSLGLAQAAQAGIKPISKRMLNIVKKNHLYVAEVRQPGSGLKLFDACVDGDNLISKSATPASRCVEKEWEIDNDDRAQVFPEDYVLTNEEYQNRINHHLAFYTPTCVKWESYSLNVPIDRIGKKAVNCKWVNRKDHPVYGGGSDDGKDFDKVRLCDYVDTPTSFPLTQTIVVHQLSSNTSGERVYYHSSHHDDKIPGGGRYKYTIPACQ